MTPDVINTVPDAFLEVEYTKTGKRANLGNELAPKDVKDIPQVKYDAEPDSFYTLILTDPDAPSRKNPTRREWNHWLVSNHEIVIALVLLRIILRNVSEITIVF